MAERGTDASGIEIRHLYKIFGTRPEQYVDAVERGMTKKELIERHHHVLGLKDISITIPGGCLQVIMGLSGSGKSTLIRHINRLIDPTAGEVLVGGVDVVRMNEKELREFRRHKTGMVFQKFALLPHRTVLDNTVYGLEVQGVPRKRQVEAAMRWIERVGLSGYEKNYPNQLSGGMQQRVGLARALTNDAPILLMDEAFSALDPLIRMDMQTILLDLQKEIRKTIVFITHDLDEALRLGEQIAILRDGEVIQQGTGQDIVLRPADDYIARFVKEVNRSRVIRADAIMQPLRPGTSPDGPPVPGSAVLEEAVLRMTDAGASIAHVVDRQGVVLGVLDLHSVLAAMASPATRAARAEAGGAALEPAT
jgi:glycine betaine/proline transport system ATP-binding protein